MRNSLALLIIVISTGITVSAQTEGELKQYFEGKIVTLKIDMPATKMASMSTLNAHNHLTTANTLTFSSATVRLFAATM